MLKINLTQVSQPKNIDEYEREKYGFDIPVEEKQEAMLRLAEQRFNESLAEGKQLVDKAFEEIRNLPEEQLAEKADLSNRLQEFINEQFTELNLAYEQREILGVALMDYIVGFADDHLAAVFPDEFFVELDSRLDAGVVEEKQVAYYVNLVYIDIFGYSLVDYAKHVLQKTIARLKKLIIKNRRAAVVFENITDAQRAIFTEYMLLEKIDEAGSYLESLASGLDIKLPVVAAEDFPEDEASEGEGGDEDSEDIGDANDAAAGNDVESPVNLTPRGY